MNLLKRTRRLLQGLSSAAPAKAQYYSVTCPEGHRLRGERTEGYQALRCPTCGEGIFVLPRSPLPEPVSKETPREPRKVSAPLASEREDAPVAFSDPVVVLPSGNDLDVDGEIEWVDEGLEESSTGGAGEGRDQRPPEARPKPSAKSGKSRKDVPVPDRDERPADKAPTRPRGAAPAATPRKPVPERAVPVIVQTPRERLVRWAIRRRHPLIFLAVGLLVVGTVGYRLWRSRFQELPRIAELGRVEGLVALDSGKFDSAEQLLSEANRAVESLGGAVEGAVEIRQGAKEAAIITSLVPDSLESILANASADPKEWASRFGTLYKGRTIICDVHITAVPDASGAGGYEIDYRIFPATEGSKRVGRISLSGFKLLEDPPRKLGDRVVFGARLASFALETESNEWVVGLEPESGVFMTHTKALQALGWPSVDELAPEDQP